MRSLAIVIGAAAVCLAVLCSGRPAGAQDEAEIALDTFAVTGVGRNDVLNIRSNIADYETVQDAPIAGTIAPGDRGVFATGRTARVRGTLWREVAHQGVVGWVNARFLSATGDRAPGDLPQALSCSGAEPFWFFSADTRMADLETTDGNRRYAVAAREVALNRRTEWAMALDGQQESPRAYAIFRTDRMCSDGMSDIDYPIEALLIGIGGSSAPLSGCCSAVP